MTLEALGGRSRLRLEAGGAQNDDVDPAVPASAFSFIVAGRWGVFGIAGDRESLTGDTAAVGEQFHHGDGPGG